MLDIKFIRENPDLVQKANKAKNFSVDIQGLLALDQEIRPLQQELETLQNVRNTIAKEMPSAAPAERESLKQKALETKIGIENVQNKLKDLKQDLQDKMLYVAQPAAEDVPFGKDDKDNVQVKTWGDPTKFDFKPLDHITLGEKLGILDFERGVKLSGSRSYILKGDGALLENAILRFTFDLLVKKGFTPMSVPVLVNEQAMVGTGYFPAGREQAYYCEKDQQALVGTSEVSLCGMLADETLEEKNLPIKMMAQTTCFRREAGTYGKDTRGLYRVHQFQKIEMVIIAEADKALSEKYHAELLGLAETVLQALKLPYKVVYVCTGDLGQGQVRKHDIETWMPSRDNYGETHSCSTFYDFQARRLNLRYKDKSGERKVAFTLNNTACAAPRLLLAIMENFQTQDGKILVPECLQPYMGKSVIGI